MTAWTTRCTWIRSLAPSTLASDSRCNWVAAARNRCGEERNSARPGGSSMPSAGCRKKLGRDRFRGEERAQVEQVLGVGGQQRDRHRPGTRDRGREIGSVGCSLSSWWAFSVNRAEVLLDALAGLARGTRPRARRRWADGRASVASRLASLPRRSSSARAESRFRAARLGTVRRRKLTDSASVKGETSMLSATM